MHQQQLCIAQLQQASQQCQACCQHPSLQAYDKVYSAKQQLVSPFIHILDVAYLSKSLCIAQVQQALHHCQACCQHPRLQVREQVHSAKCHRSDVLVYVLDGWNAGAELDMHVGFAMPAQCSLLCWQELKATAPQSLHPAALGSTSMPFWKLRIAPSFL